MQVWILLYDLQLIKNHSHDNFNIYLLATVILSDAR